MGEVYFVYLVDFGIARAVYGDGPGLTMTGAAMGSFDSMAPSGSWDSAWIGAPMCTRWGVCSMSA